MASPSPRSPRASPPPPRKRWVVICSPVSGKKQGQAVVEKELLPALRKASLDVSVAYTKHFQHAIELAKYYGAEEDVGIVAVGGDGTINEVLTGLLEAGALSRSVVGILSQGTMNFYGVTAGLPRSASALAESILANETRPVSLMRVTSPNGRNAVSFEAAHIGHMAYKVCKGAQDWRFTLGPMFGIFLHLIKGNLFPEIQRGTLTIYPQEGGSPIKISDDFFWIIITHRNPYNGVVGREMWVSYLTLKTFPGFGRMMEFFEPPMEHFQGTARCFGLHHCCVKVEFELSATLADGKTKNPDDKVALVIDGDAKGGDLVGRSLAIANMSNAFRVIGTSFPPASVDSKFFAPKTLTPGAEKWLNMNPPPRDMMVPEAKRQVVLSEVALEAQRKKRMMMGFVIVMLVVLWVRRRR